MNNISHSMLEPGDIVQVNPESHWGGCLVVIDEIKTFGIQGYTRIPGKEGGNAYIRLSWAEIEPTGGRAVWVTK